MSYINETLLAGEKLIYRTHRHWIIFWPVAFWLFISVLISLVLPPDFFTDIFGSKYVYANLTVVDILALIAFIIALFTILTGYLNYITSEFGVTGRRVLMKVGVIRRYSVEVFLERVESINVRQSILGRILDFGTVQVIGTGGTHDYFRFIQQPLRLRREVNKQLHEINSREHGNNQ